MTQIDLGPLNEDCIALRDGLACKCEEDGQPVLALTLRQIASRYQRLLNKLFAEQANDAAEKRVAELEAALAAHQWRPVTADWPPCNRQVVISAPGASWADVARKQHDGEEYVWQLKNGHVLDFESATVATPLPPAPAPQEPTP